MTSDSAPADPLAELVRRSRAIARLFGDDGRISRWPKRRRERLMVLDHLAAHFEPGRRYTEAEVNRLLDGLHAFEDSALLRRMLVDEGLVQRRADGSAYWLVEAS